MGDFWNATAAEYQATAEAHLERLGARNIQTPSAAGSIMADFLLMFGGGGGAPQDLVKPRAEGFETE